MGGVGSREDGVSEEWVEGRGTCRQVGEPSVFCWSVRACSRDARLGSAGAPDRGVDCEESI
jgi:hypothetical protein